MKKIITLFMALALAAGSVSMVAKDKSGYFHCISENELSELRE